MVKDNKPSWHILYLCAHPARLNRLRTLLEEAPGLSFHLDQESSFESGLLKLNSAAYQAILIDADLEPRGGIEFLREAAAQGQAVPLFLLDSQYHPDTDRDALQAGAAFYLAEPELTAALLDRVLRYAGQRQAQAGKPGSREGRPQPPTELNQPASSEAQLIRERDELNAELEAEKARWKGVVEGIADEIWICDAQGHMSMMNLAAINAMRLAEFKDHTREDVNEDVEIYELNGAVRAPDQWPLLRSLRGEIVRGEEIMRDRRTGNTRYRQYSSAPMHDAAGAITGSVAIVRDVTDYRRMEEHLRQSEAQLRAIFEAMSDAVIVMDRDGSVVRANHAAREMLGFDPTDSRRWEKASSFLSFTRPDGTPYDPRTQIRSRVLRGEQVIGERLRVTGPTGKITEILTSASPLLDEQQAQNGMVIAWHNITELAQIQQSLADQHQRLVNTLESIQDGFMEINWDWRFTYLNQRAAQVSGLQPDQLIGKIIWEAYPILLGSPLETLYRKVMDQRQPDTMETIGAVTGSWFDIRVYPSSTGITIFWTDITRRKQLEEEQRKLLIAVEQSPNTIIITDAQSRIEYVNPRFSEVTGYSAEQVIGKDPAILKTGYTTPEEYAEMWRVIQSGEVWHGVFRNKKRNGEIYWESASIVPIYDGNHQIRNYLAVQEDITERKRAEEALERSEAHLRRLFDTSVIGILSREPGGRILQMNDSLLQMLGYTRQEFEAHPLHINDLLLEESSAIDFQITQEVMRDGSSRPREKEYRRKDGSHVPVLVGLTRLEGPQEETFAFIFDLTELKESQAAVAEYTEKLKRSNQDLEQFAFVVSHDLQEPLRKITFFSDSISKKIGSALDAETRDSLERMQSASRRMREMIQDLLDLSRVSTRAEAFQEVNLAEVAQDAISDLEGRIHKENGQVQVGALPVIQADRSQMQRLLQNLISNALKYHKKDVPPLVKISARVTSPKNHPGKQLILMVEDNGIGFDEQYAERIFQPFQRLHGRSEYEGTGMGLTICRKIVERHHGQISASSQPGQGSTFIVQLPVRQRE